MTNKNNKISEAAETTIALLQLLKEKELIHQLLYKNQLDFQKYNSRPNSLGQSIARKC